MTTCYALPDKKSKLLLDLLLDLILLFFCTFDKKQFINFISNIYTSIIYSQCSISERNNNLIKTENKSKGKCGEDAHP